MGRPCRVELRLKPLPIGGLVVFNSKISVSFRAGLRVIEAAGAETVEAHITQAHIIKAHVLTAHHNVGGLPHDMVHRHLLSEPGLGIRILGEIKQRYVDIQRSAAADVIT